MLLDEPLANLDAKLRHDTRAELKRLQRDLNMTMVYATPDQLEALTMGDNITIIKEGKFIQKGTPDELYDNPDNIYVGKMIGSPEMNILKEKINDYRNQKKNELNNLNNQRFELTKKLLDELNPLLANYSTEKSLAMIVDKKSIVIGKKNLDITNDILKQLNNTLKNVEVN